MSKQQWGRSTFLPRPLPTAIIFDDGEIIGPFCAHCGAIQEWHGPNNRCPLKVNPLWPTPSCTCHAVALIDGPPRPNTRIRIGTADGPAYANLNASGQIIRATQERGFPDGRS